MDGRIGLAVRVLEKCGLTHTRTYFDDELPAIDGADQGYVEYQAHPRRMGALERCAVTRRGSRPILLSVSKVRSCPPGPGGLAARPAAGAGEISVADGPPLRPPGTAQGR